LHLEIGLIKKIPTRPGQKDINRSNMEKTMFRVDDRLVPNRVTALPLEPWANGRHRDELVTIQKERS
jgi:hypothetical protein